MTSALFKNLGLASGLDGSGPTTENPAPTPAPGTKVVQPGFPDMPLYVPKDTRKLKITDTRKVNPATGRPFKQGAPMSASVNPEVINFVINQAMKKGVDPNTALAIALQETKIGNLNENVGSAWSTFSDEGIENPYEQGANAMVKALVDKLAYAKRLGYDKKGEAYALQAYNGYGKLFPQNTAPGAVESFYEIPVSRNNPLNLANNPIYGKTIMSLRDEVIKQNPEIQKLIQQAMAKRNATPMQAPGLTYTASN